MAWVRACVVVFSVSDIISSVVLHRILWDFFCRKFRDHIQRLLCPVKVIGPSGRGDAGSTRAVDVNSATASKKKTFHRVQPFSPDENSKCNTPLSADTVFSPHISTPLVIKSCVLQPRDVLVCSSSTPDVDKQSSLANTDLGNSNSSSLMHLKSTTMFAYDCPKGLSDQLLPPVENHDPTEPVSERRTATGTSYSGKAHNYSIA
ncbi:hypothetical protein DPMN_042724 [Dreissena polymorpha]|uniref:Uncharacterized protein n=1 Tax=Dreissena polymorpha TaxID=45954 RepID=A0A9D4HX83_DREPO|nr:hypothetical protein DPMN_042724 [Dreissena polymorpha]